MLTFCSSSIAAMTKQEPLGLGFLARKGHAAMWKVKNLRAFCFSSSDRVLTKLMGLHGLQSGNTVTRYTPRFSTELGLGIGKAVETQVELDQQCKQINPSCALGAFCSFIEDKESGEREIDASIHPRINLGISQP